MKLITKRRRLFFDIETSPNVGLFWSAGYKQRVDYDNIIKERAIICIAYKWEEEKEVYCIQWDGKQSDKKLLQKFIEVANQSIELVGHNGDKFDLPWIRTRCLYHRIDMFPHYTSVDTLKISRSKFKFNSNRLNYIANYLGLGGKIKTDFALWKKIVLQNDKAAMKKLADYCKRDVILLENVYNHLKFHTKHVTHYGVIFGQDKSSCPECGSDDLVRSNSRITSTGLKKIQYRCNTCKRYHSKNG
jgi:uncharacterized protein YprB with RNaseH-like and TPR domain